MLNELETVVPDVSVLNSTDVLTNTPANVEVSSLPSVTTQECTIVTDNLVYKTGDVPSWVSGYLDSYIKSLGLVDPTLLSQYYIDILSKLDLVKNGYTELLTIVNDTDTKVTLKISQLDSTIDNVANSKITQLMSTYATNTETSALIDTLLKSAFKAPDGNYNTALNNLVSTTVANAYSSYTATVQSLITNYSDSIDTLQTQVIEAKSTATDAMTNWNYNSTLKIRQLDGTYKYYNSGFGLVSTGTTVGTINGVPVFDSEFWVKADKLKLTSATNDNYSPFYIDGTGIYLNSNVHIGKSADAPQYYYGSGAPTNTTNITTGSVYTDTSTNPSTVYTFLNGAWVNSAGKGIKSTVTYFAISTSNSVAPTTGWVTTAVSTSSTNKYLWSYQVTTYTDNSTVSSTKIVVGVYGDTGPQGPQGAQGSTGATGSRGTAIGYGTSVTNSAFTSSTGLSPISGDQLIVTNSSGTIIYNYNGGSWVNATSLQINGNAVIDGTLVASKIAAGAATLGSGYYFALGGSGQANRAAAVVGFANSSNVGVAGQSSSGSGVHGTGNDGLYGVGWNGKNGQVGAGAGYSFHAGAGAGMAVFRDGVAPFTGVHEAIIAKDSTITIGDIVVDDFVVYKDDISNTLTEVVVATTEMCKSCVGVYSSDPDLPFPLALGLTYENSSEYVLNPIYKTFMQGYRNIHINSLGEGQVNVCGLGGNLEIGDLITTSTIPGKGMKQKDDVVRNYTVAKCREYVQFDYPEQVKTVACIYMCG